MTTATDWDRYYRNTPKYTSITRSFSARKITGLLKQYAPEAKTLCELGGANSCFVEAVTNDLPLTHYHAVDLNAYGLSLLKKKTTRCELTSELADVLEPARGPTFDIVYSVGLIEHFDPKGTSKAIAAHFQRCRPGGIVLITFPTPTPLYNTIRGAAELGGVWNFPDERPLHFQEVREGIPSTARVVHESINWLIGLTQGYIIAKKDSDA